VTAEVLPFRPRPTGRRALAGRYGRLLDRRQAAEAAGPVLPPAEHLRAAAWHLQAAAVGLEGSRAQHALLAAREAAGLAEEVGAMARHAEEDAGGPRARPGGGGLPPIGGEGVR